MTKHNLSLQHKSVLYNNTYVCANGHLVELFYTHGYNACMFRWWIHNTNNQQVILGNVLSANINV